MKKSLSLFFIFLINISILVGCNSLNSNENIDIDKTETGVTTTQNSNEEVNETSMNEIFEQVFKEKYPEIRSLPFHSTDKHGTFYYSIDNGNVMFKTNTNFVEYIDLQNNGFKVGVYYGDYVVLEEQKIRFYVRSGFLSYPDMSLEEQYKEMISVIKALIEIDDNTIPTFDIFNSNIKLTKNLVGGKHYEYQPNNNLKFIVEESINKNNEIESRDMYCDIINNFSPRNDIVLESSYNENAIKVAVCPTGNFAFTNDNGKFEGIDIDVMNALTQKLDFDVIFNTVDRNDCLELVANGEYDFCIGALVPGVFMEGIVYSDPYMTDIHSVIVSGDSAYGSYNDFYNNAVKNNFKIGTINNSISFYIASNGTQNFAFDERNVKGYDTTKELISALEHHEISAIIVDRITALNITQKKSDFKKLDKNFDESYISILMPSNDTQLLKKVNQVLKELKDDGTIEAIVKKYAYK